MNAIATPRHATPPPMSTEDDALARMAQNRSQERRPVMREPGPPPSPLAREAFLISTLELAITAARTTHDVARRRVLLTRDKVEKADARKAVKIAAAALAVAEAALASETRGELVAPSVQRRAHIQDGIVLREPRVVVSATKRAELQPAIERLRNRGSIDVRLYSAARRYRDAWETAGMDAYPVGMAGDGGFSAPQSGNRRIEAAVGAHADLDGARRAIGVFGTGMVEHVVVNDLTIGAFAAKKGCSPEEAMGTFKMVLERLAEHWAAVADQPKRRRAG